MKKILIAEGLDSLLQQQDSFLKRSDIRTFTAATNDSLLAVHQAERVDLIITRIDLPGMDVERLVVQIRKDPSLRAAQLIIVCPDSKKAIGRAARCKPSAVFLFSDDSAALLARAQMLLPLETRDTLRVMVSADVEGTEGNAKFFCKCQDISATGMLIETDRKLRAVSRIVCSFFLPDAGQVRATGEIVRSVDGTNGARQYGLKFLQMMPLDRITLETFIAAKSRKGND